MSAEFGRAFAELARRIEGVLKRAEARDLPVRMYVAGGRATEDVGAAFSRRVILGDVEVAYRDVDGRARMLYLDRNYNDTLGLLHEDAYADAKRVDVPGVDRKVLEVRVLAPVDVAVTKPARFADADREDIELLARRGLIDSAALRTSIDVACRLVDAHRKKRG